MAFSTKIFFFLHFFFRSVPFRWKLITDAFFVYCKVLCYRIMTGTLVYTHSYRILCVCFLLYIFYIHYTTCSRVLCSSTYFWLVALLHVLKHFVIRRIVCVFFCSFFRSFPLLNICQQLCSMCATYYQLNVIISVRVKQMNLLRKFTTKWTILHSTFYIHEFREMIYDGM